MLDLRIRSKGVDVTLDMLTFRDFNDINQQAALMKNAPCMAYLMGHLFLDHVRNGTTPDTKIMIGRVMYRLSTDRYEPVKPWLCFDNSPVFTIGQLKEAMAYAKQHLEFGVFIDHQPMLFVYDDANPLDAKEHLILTNDVIQSIIQYANIYGL